MSIKITPLLGVLPSNRSCVGYKKNGFGLYTLEIAGGFVKDKHKHKKTNIKSNAF